MKLFFWIILFLLSLSMVNALCVAGIDDPCDPQCIREGFICNQDPHADSSCIFGYDGVCDQNCLEEDADCLLNTASETQSTENFSSPSLIITERTPTLVEYFLLGIGAILVSIIGYYLFIRFALHYRRKQYEELLPYGQHALLQGYSIESIKDSLKHKGYSDDYIKGYIKALEFKP